MNNAENIETVKKESYIELYKKNMILKQHVNLPVKYVQRNIVIEPESEEDEYLDCYEKYENFMETQNIKSVPITINKNITCKECNTPSIIEDMTRGTMVCNICGQVSNCILDTNTDKIQYNDDNKKESNRTSFTINPLLPQSSATTQIGGTGSNRIKKLHGWNSMPYKERTLNEIFKIIHTICTKGNILKCIEDDAKIMYKTISTCKHLHGKNKGKFIIIRGVNKTSLIAGCISMACKKKDKIRSHKEIATLFGLKNTEITKGYKKFIKLAKQQNIDLTFCQTDPKQFIIRFCEELKIKKEYTDQSIQLSNNVQKLQIAEVHTPLSLATGAIYTMTIINKLNISKKQIADKFNVSQVTISKTFKKIEPYIKLLTDDAKCDKMAELISTYQKDVVIDPMLIPSFVRFDVNIPDKFLKIYDDDTGFNKKLYDSLLLETIYKQQLFINELINNISEIIEESLLDYAEYLN